MKKLITKSYFYYILGSILFLLIWFLLSLIIDEKTLIFPGPIDTFKYTIKLLKDKYVYKCILGSISRLIIGFIISLLFGVILGVISGLFDKVYKLLYPTITILKSLPTVTLLFLFLVIVKSTFTPILIVILVSFPIIYESMVGGIKSISREVEDSIKLDGNNSLKNIFKVKIPLAIPYLLVGIASSFALSFKIEIMAEVLTGFTKNGLGFAILANQKTDPTNMVPIFAYSLITILIVLIISLISNLIKDKLVKKELIIEK